MRVFFQSLDEKVWQDVEIGQTKPTEVPADWDEAKIIECLFSAVTNEDVKTYVIQCQKHMSTFYVIG